MDFASRQRVSLCGGEQKNTSLRSSGASVWFVLQWGEVSLGEVLAVLVSGIEGGRGW